MCVCVCVLFRLSWLDVAVVVVVFLFACSLCIVHVYGVCMACCLRSSTISDTMCISDFRTVQSVNILPELCAYDAHILRTVHN